MRMSMVTRSTLPPTVTPAARHASATSRTPEACHAAGTLCPRHVASKKRHGRSRHAAPSRKRPRRRAVPCHAASRQQRRRTSATQRYPERHASGDGPEPGEPASACRLHAEPTARRGSTRDCAVAAADALPSPTAALPPFSATCSTTNWVCLFYVISKVFNEKVGSSPEECAMWWGVAGLGGVGRVASIDSSHVTQDS